MAARLPSAVVPIAPPPPATSWFGRINLALAALLALGVPFIGFTRLILNHFYVRGAFIWDTGLIAALMWHSDLALTQPATVGGGSFFAVHVAPLFLLLSAISRVLPCGMAQFFALYIGVSHALLALAVFWLLVAGFGMRRGPAVWLAALLAIVFAFDGLVLAIARYPHFELLIAAAFLLFAVAQALGHARLAAGCFLLGLLTREDAGLHYAGILAVFVVLRTWRGTALRAQRTELIYLGAGLAYSAAVLLIQHAAFPGHSSFVRIYLGTPPLVQLTVPELHDRLAFFAANRAYIWAPALGAALWATRRHNPFAAVGYIACIPWALVNLLAFSILAGTLSSYYAFPFVIALGWPLVSAYRQPGPHEVRQPVLWFAGLLLLTFIPAKNLHNPGHLRLPRDFLTAPSVAIQEATDRAVAALSAGRGHLGQLLVGNSVAALAPNGFAPQNLLNDRHPVHPDTVAFFTHGFDADRLRTMARADGLTHRYDVPGTEMHLASRLDLQTIQLGALLVVERPSPGA